MKLDLAPDMLVRLPLRLRAASGAWQVSVLSTSPAFRSPIRHIQLNTGFYLEKASRKYFQRVWKD